jgi:hydrogenase maturation factor
MKYLDEYRDGDVAQKIVSEMRRIQTRPWVLMEVCGGQTHSIVTPSNPWAAMCASSTHRSTA